MSIMNKNLKALFWCSILISITMAKWEALGPHSADIGKIMLSPTDDKVVYAITREKGKITVSEDAGKTWGSRGSYDFINNDLAINSDGSKIYAATYTAIFYSDDGGRMWSTLHSITSTRIMKIWASPTNPDLIYVYGNNQESQSLYFGRSEDGGSTWKDVSYAGNSSYYTWAEGFTVDSRNCDIIYTVSTVQSGGGYAGVIHKSVNGGNTFKKLYSVGLSFGNGQLLKEISIAVSGSDSKVLFLGGGTGKIKRSVDGGENWKTVCENMGTVSKIEISDTISNIIYAIGSDKVAVSKDNGETWNVTAIKKGAVSNDFTGLTVSRQNCGVAYLSGWLSTYMTSDTGRTWERTDADMNLSSIDFFEVSPSNPSILYITQHGHGMYRSDNNGTDWTFLTPATGIIGGDNHGFKRDQSAIVVSPDDPNTIYMLDCGSRGFYNYNHVYKSTDGGIKWKRDGDEKGFFTTYGGYSLAIDPGDSDILWCGGRYYNKSTKKFPVAAMKIDGIKDWPNGKWNNYKLTDSELGCIYNIAIDPTDGNIVYASGEADGKSVLFKTTDGGSNWNNITDNTFGRYLKEIAIDPTNTSILYAAASSALYKSMDAGASWIKKDCQGATAIVINPDNNNVLYAGTYVGGVWRSEDGAETWVKMSDGLGENAQEISTLKINPGKYLFAGTNGSSVYRWDFATVGTINHNTPTNKIESKLNIKYANNNVINISFDIAKSSLVKLSIFDIRGREVAVLANKSYNAGTHTISVGKKIRNLSKGIYVCKMSVDNFTYTKSLIFR